MRFTGVSRAARFIQGGRTLHMPEPLSTTRAATSSSDIFVLRVFV